MNSQVAVEHLQHRAAGEGQWLSRIIIARVPRLVHRGVDIKLHWVPGHVGVKGNEQTDRTVKVAAE